MLSFFKKTIKIIFYISIAILFLFLVDFQEFSFKTITPEKINQTEVSEGTGVGVVRNTEEVETQNDQFEGNEQDIVDLVNQARQKAGLGILKVNEKLSLSAMDKAQHMKDNDYFDHVSPEGLQPWYFAEKQDYNYKSFGENLAEGYFSADSVHQGWMDSPGHRENILSEKFKEIGVAVLEFQRDDPVSSGASRGKQKSYLAVQHFGSRLLAEDLMTEIVCDKKSKENCEDAEKEEDRIEKLIEEQEEVIKRAEKAGAGSKDLNRLEENLEELKDAEDDLEDYLKECDSFLKKCDSFK